MAEMNKSEGRNSEKLKIDPIDSKAKFRKALEKKKQGGGIRHDTIMDHPRNSSSQASGNVPKMFRRKSGSA